MRVIKGLGFAFSAVGLLQLGPAIAQQPQGNPGAPPAGQGQERRGRSFEDIDTNQDGQISREEYAARRGGRGGPGGFDQQGQGGPGGQRGPLGGPQGNQGQGDGRRRGGPFFGMFDTNRDGKIQTAEIQRVIDVFKKALEASQEGDLTQEDWRELTAELRPPGGFGGNRPGGPDGPGSPQDNRQRNGNRPPPPNQ